MRKATRAAGCVITLILTIGLLFCMTNLTERKTSDNKYHDFFQDRDYDVLFMGTSHVINSVFPMELWKEYGITSFNCGGTSNFLPTTYWVLENALDYVTPKAVVIDCLHLSSDRKCPDIARAHFSLDAFPLSLTKIKATLDLMDDPEENENPEAETRANAAQRSPLELLWDFSIYHSRWNELKEDDFAPAPNQEKGADTRINVVQGKLEKIDPGASLEPGHTGEVYLRKMIESCRDRGIQVMLTYFPFPASEIEQREANRAYEIAEEYGIPYVNFLDHDEIIDYRTDLYDSYSHVNASGGRKLTSWLGGQLVRLFDLPDRRNDPAYSYWEEDYQEYEALKDNHLKEQEDLVNYLMLLAGDDTDTVIYIQDQAIFRSEQILLQLKNLGVDPGELGDSTDFILVGKHGREAVVLNSFTEDGKTEKTKFGEASVLRFSGEETEKGEYLTLTVDGWESMKIRMDSNPGMQINVYRHGGLVDSVKFQYTVNSLTDKVDTSKVIRQ